MLQLFVSYWHLDRLKGSWDPASLILTCPGPVRTQSDLIELRNLVVRERGVTEAWTIVISHFQLIEDSGNVQVVMCPHCKKLVKSHVCDDNG